MPVYYIKHMRSPMSSEYPGYQKQVVQQPMGCIAGPHAVCTNKDKSLQALCRTHMIRGQSSRYLIYTHVYVYIYIYICTSSYVGLMPVSHIVSTRSLMSYENPEAQNAQGPAAHGLLTR